MWYLISVRTIKTPSDLRSFNQRPRAPAILLRGEFGECYDRANEICRGWDKNDPVPVQQGLPFAITTDWTYWIVSDEQIKK